MKGLASIVVVGGIVAAFAAAPAAQRPQEQQRLSASAREATESRFQIGQMERVLEGAVEHGGAVTRDRLQAVLPPGDMQISGENAYARGFRLEGYGVFFDVIVPSFETETTLAWSVRTLDQNDLGLESALKALQAHVKTAGDTNLEQALRRVELQVNPAVQARQSVPVNAGARNATGSAAAVGGDVAAAAPADPILSDPNEAYRTEVTQALKDAMLEHSSSLKIGADEWLTVAAKGSDDRPRLAPADSDARTRMLRLRGADLIAYLARQITKEQALQRIEVLVF
jgi:hypothetical protein